jgi:hypothetical protein
VLDNVDLNSSTTQQTLLAILPAMEEDAENINVNVLKRDIQHPKTWLLGQVKWRVLYTVVLVSLHPTQHGERSPRLMIATGAA